MERVLNINEALELLKKHHTLVGKPYGSKGILYTLCGDKILVQNNNLKSFVSLEEFKEDFNLYPFYYVQIKSTDEEIDQTHIVYRQ